ncbi:MAG: hypothetical protein IPG67_04505 [Acidobacteria bacterium]|nr:hypothetical protein [Acidobacteriota bacterium]
MGRIIVGVVVGFIVWSIVWVGSEQTLGRFWTEFGAHTLEAEKALTNNTSLETSPAIAIANLIRSFLTSVIAGYLVALAAGEYKRSTMILGVILVAVGIAVEYMFWNLAPAWYHILFVLFLLPMTIVGGRMRRAS